MSQVSIRVGGEWVVKMCGDGNQTLRKLGQSCAHPSKTKGGADQPSFWVRRCADGALLDLDKPIGKVLRNNDFVDLGN